MLNAQLLQTVWEDSFLGKRPYEILTLVGFELAPLGEREFENGLPILTEMEHTACYLAEVITEKAEGDPLSIFTTALALGYLCANREVLDGESS